MNSAEATRLFAMIRKSIQSAADLKELIASAYGGQAWKAAGYESWEACCTSEFGELIAELEKAQQRELISALHHAGLSTRAIAQTVGVNQSTVSRNLDAGDAPGQQNASPDRQSVAPVNGRQGLDGKVYPSPPRRPEVYWDQPPAQKPPSDADLLAGADWTPAPDPPKPRPAPVMLTLRTHDGQEVPYPKPQSPATFNQTDGDGISWAKWSWNPVTGCLHGCDYCYARAIAARWTDAYPAGFTPLFHRERLDAPANTAIPAAHRNDSHEACADGTCDTCAYRRVFVCSMADLYGRWVSSEWISEVHEAMMQNPRWQYILLTKFPDRYPGLEFPPGAWVGTSVDEQKRVRIAERAFGQLPGDVIKWLSLEPLREPLSFTDLSMFDWVVIGAQTQTVQPDGAVPGFQPEPRWVTRILHQAAEAGISVHLKPNMTRFRAWLNQYPVSN